MTKSKVVMNGVEYEVDETYNDIYDLYYAIDTAGIFYVRESFDQLGCSFIGYYDKEGVPKRLDGPARIYNNGHVVYALGYGDISKEEFMRRTTKLGKVLHGDQ